MSCDLTTGFSLGCKDATGGVKEFYVAVRDSTTAVTQNSSGLVTGITIAGSFYKYNPRNSTSTAHSHPIGSVENGTFYAEHEVKMKFNKWTQAKRNEVQNLGKANVLIIAKLQDDTYWLFGQDNGLELAPSEAPIGTAIGDFQGYDLTFTGMEPEMATQCQYAAFSASLSGTQL